MPSFDALIINPKKLDDYNFYIVIDTFDKELNLKIEVLLVFILYICWIFRLKQKSEQSSESENDKQAENCLVIYNRLLRCNTDEAGSLFVCWSRIALYNTSSCWRKISGSSSGLRYLSFHVSGIYCAAVCRAATLFWYFFCWNHTGRCSNVGLSFFTSNFPSCPSGRRSLLRSQTSLLFLCKGELICSPYGIGV